ncbi:MAG: anthranilate synthase component I family protein [Saprospiraceae bacterium]
MTRTKKIFPVQNPIRFKRQLLHFAAGYSHAFYLDGNEASDGSWDCLVGLGVHDLIQLDSGDAFNQLRAWQAEHSDWLFGFFSYDLKNEVEQLKSENFDGVQLPEMGFFVPELVCGIRNDALEVYAFEADVDAVFSAISTLQLTESWDVMPCPEIRPRLSDQAYLEAVRSIQNHIVEGDVYEMNLCREYFCEGTAINPLQVFERLNARSRAPFTCYMQWGGHFLLSASPERFLKKTGDQLLTQPIKGTRKRGLNQLEDEAIINDLKTSEKDRAENVMIVDLVRNDLAKNCIPGTVRVDELFGIYTFPTVHQMISSVRGQLRPDANAIDAIRDAFPMGSMTGAPKVMAMELIEQYEQSKRGLYSGAVGYFTPDGDFDFNVVIRSILYNANSQYTSFQVGGAIVYDSVPELELEECAIKAQALVDALQADC